MLRFFFVAFLLTLLSLKSAVAYVPAILLLWLGAGRELFRLNKKVVLSVLFFNSAVTIGYMAVAFFEHFSPYEYLLYINLKVYSTTFFVMLFFSRVDVAAFFAFSKTLSYLLMLTLSMVHSYMKTFTEFRLAVGARGGIEDMAFLQRVSLFFFQKAMHDSKERALAMKARGFFDD